jgi:hypothetical protein
LKSSIHAFWLVAVAVADRIAISPEHSGTMSHVHWAIELPMRLKSVWLTNTS